MLPASTGSIGRTWPTPRGARWSTTSTAQRVIREPTDSSFQLEQRQSSPVGLPLFCRGSPTESAIIEALMPKRFTLVEAQSLIPRVGQLLRDAIELKAAYDGAE